MTITGEPRMTQEQHTTDGESVIQTDIELSKSTKEANSVIDEETEHQANRMF